MSDKATIEIYISRSAMRREKTMSDKATIEIYKSPDSPSRPWCADVIWENGQKWRKHCYGYRTKKALIREFDLFDYPIVRVEDRNRF